ncbi:MAG: ArnT family glycosyltransferase [Solirubrobacteraceae bacterium]
MRNLIRTTHWEAGLLWLAVAVFVAVSAWWLTQDTRMLDYDSGVHMASAFDFHQDISAGGLTVPFTAYNSYPPLVYLVGALTIFLVGMHPMALILSSNIVFAPLLAFGSYGVGKMVAGPRTGLLAGAFALGTPMFVSMMHQYDLDPPQAAMVAVSVWAILATRRFELLGLSAVAGLLCGLALLTKETSFIFVGGLLLAVIVRGGWRNWRGLLLFSLVVAEVAGPWYGYHFHQLSVTFTSIAEKPYGIGLSAAQAPPLWSATNGTWYLWDLVNEQTIAPFAAAFLVGFAIATVRCVRSRAARERYVPELLAGALVSYLGMTCLTHKDPRYTLPALVYIAVLGTFWIATITRTWIRRLLTGGLTAVALINFIGMSFGVGGVAARVMVSLPEAQGIIVYPELTLYEDQGWVRGGPEHNGDALALLQGLRREGVRTVWWELSAEQTDFNGSGIVPIADEERMTVVYRQTDLPDSRYVVLRTVRPGDPAPCQWLRGSSGVLEQEPGFRLGVYVIKGSAAGLDVRLLRNPANPRKRYEIACPGRPAVAFPSTRANSG